MRWSRSRTAGTLLVALCLGACSASPMLPPSFSSQQPATTGSITPASPAMMRGTPSGSFGSFVEDLWPEAKARGVSRRTFDNAFAGVSPDAKIIALTKKQAEFVRPVSDYIAKAVRQERLERGEKVAAQYATTLTAIEQRYGVPRSAIIGVWGMETNFGSFFGGNYVIEALATLAYERYRGDYFRKELLTALQILQEGHVERAGMRGSWAGAMGHTQFMPTSFMKYAVDYDGDGHKNIWGSIPDALASTAFYLKQHGWQSGQPWGFEVITPANMGGGSKTGDGEKAPFAEWAAAGVRRADGRAMPAQGEASLLRPAGPDGPVFLVTHNFKVIKRYNNSTAYALGVAHLGDRVYGGAPIRAPWPETPPRPAQVSSR